MGFSKMLALLQIYEIGKILGGLIKYYYRYLDDSIVIVQTKQEAKIALENQKILNQLLSEYLK